MKKEEIYEKVKAILVETFEMAAEDISMDSHIVDDLDLDSIDAVDLVVKLQEQTGTKLNPAVFKSVRTVADVVNAVDKLLNGNDEV